MVANSAQISESQQETQKPKKVRITLAEILLYASLLSVIATLAIITINPAKRTAEASDNRRYANLAVLRNALEDYATEHNGKYPTTYGQYWCQNCTFENYHAKGANNWIPELVAKKFVPGLPADIPASAGTACFPDPENSYAGYVYYSPSPPKNTDYKLFVFCTPSDKVLNIGSRHSAVPYCSVPNSYDSTHFNPRPAGQPELRPFVDPVRPTYAMAIYTPGLACL